MKKYLFPVIIFATLTILFSICIYHYKVALKPPYNSQSGDLIFTKNEDAAINAWLKTSGDGIAQGVIDRDAAALWIQGVFHYTGSAGWPIDTQMANHYFGLSSSYGFAPALNQLRRMYACDENNSCLALVYLNLTVSSGHIELMEFYEECRKQFVAEVGLKVAQEVEKVAIHKKALISKYVSQPRNELESIIDEDVLFDIDFWQKIYDGRLVTGNLEEWLSNNENYIRKIERLADKAKSTKQRLRSYELLTVTNK